MTIINSNENQNQNQNQNQKEKGKPSTSNCNYGSSESCRGIHSSSYSFQSISLPDLSYTLPHLHSIYSNKSLYHSMSSEKQQQQQQQQQQRPKKQNTLSITTKKPLSKQLQRIFQLPSEEELLAEYSSWLFRTALLKGYVYLTSGHLCFHAFLNSNSELDQSISPIKSGILTRRHSRKLNKVVKSWFVLNQSILSWYPSSHPSYFPTGQINLHLCTHIISAPPDSKHPTQFQLFLSDGKVLTFRSDTLQSKDEWINVLNQSILACQHDGQNVKIVIPLSTIDLVEKCDSIQFAQTIRVKIKQNTPVRPFTSNSKFTSSPRNQSDDGSLNDYFFGFLQDSQAPYDSINTALNLARSSARSLNNPNSFHLTPKSHHFSLPPVDHPTSPPQSTNSYSIRDSTRFTIPTVPPLTSSTRDYYRNSLLSLSQPQSGSTSPAEFLHSSQDERTSKLSTAINRIARSSNQFVGSPIRTSCHLVKVHQPTSSSPTPHSNSLLPHSIQSSQIASNSTASPSSSIELHRPDDMIKSNQEKNRTSSTPSSFGVQSHSFPPKDYHRLQYSTCSNNSSRERPRDSPQASTSNSPISTPRDQSFAESSKPWTLLPGWLKNVPNTLSPIKSSKDVIPQTATDSEESSSEARLTEKDELKFQTDFNFLSSGLTSNRGPMRLLLKTKCNLIKGGSSTFGHFYLASPIQPKSPQHQNVRKSSVCFRGLKWGSTLTKMILPVEELTMIKSEGNKLHLITNHQHLPASLEPHELWFEFSTEHQLKLVHEELNKMIETCKSSTHQRGSEEEEESFVYGEELEGEMEEEDAEEDDDDHEQEEDERVGEPQASSQPIMFQSSSSSFITFKPQSKLHITCLTIGSRGDVQPYIALCQKLQLDGHKCRIASHGEYRKWVEEYGIEFYEIGGDPAELMKICVDNGMFTLGFLKEAFSKFRGWLDDLLLSSYEACIGTNVLIESPSTMAGVHIAEALQIPYFRAFTMPWTRTKEYPHAFAVPDRKMGGGYNYMTYTVFDQIFWKAMSGQVNKWRKEKLGLKSTTYEKLQIHKIPFLYNFSPTIVPCPLDWSEWIHVTGYWFIDEEDPNKLSNKNTNSNLNTTLTESNETCTLQASSSLPLPPPPVSVEKSSPSWNAPPELLQFLNRAKAQNKKVVYIGFGSIVVPDPAATTQVIIESIKTTGVYGIISKGWSERLSKTSNNKKLKNDNNNNNKDESSQINDTQLTSLNQQQEDLSMIFHVDSIPHDWLFPRIHAVCHHGGAGTTGASLRAGIPTIIKPFFGDQFFWAERVETLGIGASVRKLTVKNLTQALVNATTDDLQIKRAQSVGEQIRSESGAAKAVECIYRDLEYAKSLIKKIPKPSDENNQSKLSNINLPIISRPTRNLSYSTYRKTSTKVQSSSPNRLSQQPTNNRSVSAGLMNTQTPTSFGSTLDCEDCANNTEQMDLMGSSLLILPPSDTTTTTTFTTAATTISTGTDIKPTSPTSYINQESFTDQDENSQNYNISSPIQPTSSSSENFFDCDLENSKNLFVAGGIIIKSKNLDDEKKSPNNNNHNNKNDQEVVNTNTNEINDSTSAVNNIIHHQKDNSNSDEDSSSWDILSQGSNSGPSSNELSNSFDQI